MSCKWVVRPGTKNTFWAYTPCKPGFNYLSKVKVPSEETFMRAYWGKRCPICGDKIELNLELLKDNLEVTDDRI